MIICEFFYLSQYLALSKACTIVSGSSDTKTPGAARFNLPCAKFVAAVWLTINGL